ncbi:MAG: protein-disulfide reductase DsbD family protein [Planctomycetota bacterium]|jgi:suppressor for copper-sensitivity B
MSNATPPTTPHFDWQRFLLAVMTVWLALLACGEAFAQKGGKSQPPRSKGFDLGALGNLENPFEFEAEFEVERGTGKGKVRVTATLSDGYHIFSTTQPPGGPTPTVIKILTAGVKTTGPFVPDAPPHIELNSPIFAGISIEQHDSKVTWTAPILIPSPIPATPEPLRIQIDGQVCDESCIPVRGEKVEAKFAGFIETSAAKAAEVFREEDSAVEWRIRLDRSTVAPGGSMELILEAVPDPEFHIYRFDLDDPETNFRTLLAITQTAGAKFGRPVSDKASVSKDLAAGVVTHFYEGPVTWRVPIRIPETAVEGETPLEGMVGYQACTMGSCDRPRGLNFSLSYVVSKTATADSSATSAPALALIGAVDFQTVAKYPRLRSWVEAPKYSQAMPLREFCISFGLAMLAGFILNFMPCVLPVIGLKVLGFVNESHGDQRRASRLTLVYAIGMISFFLAFGIASLVLRAATDQALGWGFQFGSTTFRIVVTSFMFALALSFLGVWEFPIPGFATGAKSTELSSRHGMMGAFAKGILTTLLATPCSGPFLGSALAVSLTQPAWIVMLIFLGVGIGFALPYLLIASYPAALKWIPKPGPWMETFKEILAFPMLLSVVMFINGFPKDERTAMLTSLIITWFACWMIGRIPIWASALQKARVWGLGAFVTLAGTFGAFHYLGPSPYELEWEPFSEQQLQKLVGEGKTVMVDFTAEWCQSCKWNLMNAIHTQRVSDFVKKNQVVPLIADMTKSSPELDEKLKELKSISIPVLAIYPPGKPDEPIILPDMLSEAEVLQALKEAGSSRSLEKNSLPTSISPQKSAEIR